jgi:ppGpp synthetase/RelA/SpoT-type nucleotidyltranferase
MIERLQADWARYRSEQARFARAAESVAEHVARVAKMSGIPCRVEGREKTPSEFLKKALRKRDKGYLDDPWGKTTDKAGARAVVQLEQQVDELAAALQADGALPLAADPMDTRLGDVQQLEYRGLHLQVVAPAEEGDTERIECELQLRTEAQDLWSSVVSHRFLYKPLVEVPAEVRRSLFRLVALIELFDEEVRRAMNTIRKLDGYELHELLDLAEREFLSICPHPEFDKVLSLQILSAISPSISEAELQTYADRLHEFCTDRHDDLEAAYGDYGPLSGADEVRYTLLSQPESTILFERLTSDPGALAAAWLAADLPSSLLAAIAGVWAIDLGWDA